MFTKTKPPVEPDGPTIRSPFDAVTVKSSEGKNYKLDNVLASHPSHNVHGYSFTILNTTVEVETVQIRRVGFYIAALISEVSYRKPGWSGEDTAEILAAYFSLRDESMLDLYRDMPSDLAYTITESYWGKAESDEDFTKTIVNRSLRSIDGLTGNADRAIRDYVIEDKLAERIRTHYSSANGHYFKEMS